MNELSASAERFHKLTPAGIMAARQFAMAQQRLGLAFEGVENIIGEQLSPTIAKLMNQLADFVGDHDADIEGFFKRIAHLLEEWTTPENMKELRTFLREFRTDAKLAVQTIDQWGGAVENLAGIWVGARVLGMLGNMARFTLGARAIAGLAGLSRTGNLPWLLPLTLAGDTPEGAAAHPRTPEERAAIERRNAVTNAPYGYNGHFWHDTWQWLSGGAHRQSTTPAGMPGRPGDPRGIRNNNPLTLNIIQVSRV